MSGPRERTTKQNQDAVAGLRRYVPERGDALHGNGPAARRPSAHDPSPAVGDNGERAPMATPRRLGEVLLLARQNKGIDLERAARDTKIRSHYLAALEAEDFSALPGSVYTKGFLRNYAQYLGLDPDIVIGHYRRELGSRGSERVAVVVRPLREPRAGIILTRGLFAGVLLTLLIVAFTGYVGIQFLRFAQPPTLAITRPAAVESTIDADSTVLAGTATVGATVTIQGPNGKVNASAAPDGTWSAQVPLRKGSNEFLIEAIDPQTDKRSPPSHRIITVPLPPVAEAPVLALSSPADGTSFTNGAIPIVGTTNGSSVTIAAAYLGPAAVDPAAQATPAPPPVPPPAEVAVGADGSFAGSYEVTAGSWRITVTATGQENKQTSVSRSITVAYTGVNVVVELKGGRAWLLVRVDGKFAARTPTAAGAIFESGAKLTFAASEEVTIRTGVASVTYVTVNGVPFGRLGTSASPGTWAIGPSGPPRQTST